MSIESHMVVNPFSRSDDLREPDEVKKIELGDELVDRALKVYEGIEDKRSTNKNYDQILQLEQIVLNPEQINILFQLIINKSLAYRVNQNITGLYLSKLIQDSYNAGHNNFYLNTGDTQIERMGCELKGTLENVLKLKIDGNVGSTCGADSEKTMFNINGNVGDGCGLDTTNSTFGIKGNVGTWCGMKSIYSTFNIKGNVEARCGVYTTNSTFEIDGNVGKLCGKCSHSSTFYILGDIGDDCGGDKEKFLLEYCIFKTHNRATYRKMLEMVPNQNITFEKGGNKVIFLSSQPI